MHAILYNIQTQHVINAVNSRNSSVIISSNFVEILKTVVLTCKTPLKFSVSRQKLLCIRSLLRQTGGSTDSAFNCDLMRRSMTVGILWLPTIIIWARCNTFEEAVCFLFSSFFYEVKFIEFQVVNNTKQHHKKNNNTRQRKRKITN